MTITEYTVSDASGSITDQAGKIVGVPGDPFRFYCIYNSATPTTPLTVQIVMPLGGRESGLFRFPRVGEKVLVGTGENSHYLMGYIPTYTSGTPSSQDFQTDGMFQDDGRGEVFRYEQTGKTEENKGNEPYSEIGFYHKESQWKAADGEKNDYADNNEYSYPKIDQIKIHSTGDIHESAVNHHEIKAKRLEILAGLNSYDYTTYPGADAEYSFADIKDNYDEKVKELPFGDSPGDDSNLYAGDMHLRAKNRIIIKAGDEIVIEVGRSSIIINDEGIALTTRKGRKKNVNLWDTKLLLSPQKGISLFGQNLQMEAVNIFELKDNYSGLIKSTSGILRISGRDIKMSTFPTLKYLSNHVSVITNFSQSVSAIDGIHEQGEGASFLLGNYGLIANLLIGIIGGALSDTPDKDPLDLVVTLHGVLLSMNHVVVNLICDPKTPEERDIANRTAMIVDFSLNLLFAGAILLGPGFASGFTHNSILHLRGSAHIDVNSLTYKKMVTKGDDAAAPLAGYVKKLTEWAGEKWKKSPTTAKVVLGIIGGIVAAGALSLPGVYVGAIKTTDKKTVDELKEL